MKKAWKQFGEGLDTLPETVQMSIIITMLFIGLVILAGILLGIGYLFVLFPFPMGFLFGFLIVQGILWIYRRGAK